MRDLGLAPDLVLVSPARRTQETLEALEPWEETPLVELVDQLYLAGRAQLLVALHGVAETVRSVLLIGHNPGLHELAMQLAGSDTSVAGRRMAESFPTAALAEFAVPGSWRILQTGGARLIRFLIAADLRTGGA